MAEESMSLVAWNNIIAAFWFICLGCYRALGIQASSIPVCIIFSLAEVPMALFFAFYLDTKVWGLVFSFCVSYLIQALIFSSVLIWRVDW